MKIYNVTQLAKELGVTRQTIHYWIRKEWIKPKRDYRNYPVFTFGDIKKIRTWKNSLK